MKKIYASIAYDPDNASLVSTTEESDACSYPKGYRFDYVSLYMTDCGRYFLYGKGHYGCNSIVPLSTDQAKKWLYLSNNVSVA